MKYPIETGNPNDLLKNPNVIYEIKKNIILKINQDFNIKLNIPDELIVQVLSSNIKTYFERRAIYNASAAGMLDKLMKRKEPKINIKKNNRFENYQNSIIPATNFPESLSNSVSTDNISYTIQQGAEKDNYVHIIMNRVSDILYSNYYSMFKQEENNKRLSVWNSIRGDFNQKGIRSHPIIKLNNKKNTNSIHFNMRF